MPKLELRNLSIKIKDQVILENINLKVEQGELICVFGKSGAGKSMLLNAICGFIDNEGTILIDDNDVSKVDFTKRGCILLDQDILLFNHMTVFDNIAFGLKMNKLNKLEITAKVKQLAHDLEIVQYLKRYPNELSGGQQQRVAIARALAINPKILLLDEPFSKLDLNLKNNLYNLLKNLQANYKLTIIMVTHDKKEALLLSDKIAVLANKQIIDYDIPQIIYYKPSKLETIRLFDHANIIDASLFAKANKKKLVIFYDDIILSDQGDYLATIITRDYYGDKYFYVLDYLGTKIKAYHNEELACHEKIYFSFASNKILYY